MALTARVQNCAGLRIRSVPEQNGKALPEQSGKEKVPVRRVLLEMRPVAMGPGRRKERFLRRCGCS